MPAAIALVVVGLIFTAATVAIDPFADRGLDVMTGALVFFGLVIAANYLEANFAIRERFLPGGAADVRGDERPAASGRGPATRAGHPTRLGGGKARR